MRGWITFASLVAGVVLTVGVSLEAGVVLTAGASLTELGLNG